MWLIPAHVARDIQALVDSGAAPSADRLDAAASQLDVEIEAARRPTVRGGTAEINVSGLLSKRPNPLLAFFGIQQSSYESIASALAAAESDDSVSKVVLNVDSPGGTVDGLFEALAAIEAFGKPIETRASRATSAAYAIASMTDRIVATGPAAEFGSIGVAATVRIDPRAIDITSTNAPKKRPDFSTEEGQAELRKYMDAVHELFVDAIARGRGKTPDAVNEGFGQGAVLLAKDAKSRKMIDAVAPPPKRAADATRNLQASNENEPVSSETREGTTRGPQAPEPRKERAMTLEELKAAHPHLVAQIADQARTEGAEAATKAERRRCADHLKLGEAAGILPDAIKAVAEGTDVADMQATYIAAGMNRRSVETRQQESNEAEVAAGGTTPPKDGPKDLIDIAADAVCGPTTADGITRNADGDIIL